MVFGNAGGRSHTIITTVRSKEKGDYTINAQDDAVEARLSYEVMSDIARKDAFGPVMQANPDLDYVIHTASPFLARFENPAIDALGPAISELLEFWGLSKTVVNTASPPKVYDQSSWNPVAWQESLSESSVTYRGSKTFAEKAAWGFVDKGNPSFDIVTINPPLVYGPIAHQLESLDRLNTSNLRIRDIIQGKHRDNPLPPTGTFSFTDARDLALAHVRALDVPDAGGKRFFVVAGHCSHKQIVDAVQETHPELSSLLPKNPVDDMPKEVYGYDDSRAREILGFH